MLACVGRVADIAATDSVTFSCADMDRSLSPHIPLREYPRAPDFEMTARIALGRGIFERASFELLMRHTPQRDVAVEVGAHVGSWTLGMSKLFNNVIGFEPHPVNRLYLERNLERAKPDNVTILPYAVAEYAERAFRITALHLTRNSGGAHLVPGQAEVPNTSPVAAVRLDDALPPHLQGSRRMSTLKIDVEGMELSVMRSGEDIIRAHRPTVLLEINRNCQRYGVRGEQEVQDYMSDIGYRQTGRNHNDFVFIPK
jgi:FkbM family methyltransferase